MPPSLPGPLVRYLISITIAAVAAGLGGLLWWQLHAVEPPAVDDAPAGPPWFADVTNEVGLNFVHDAGPLGKFFLPETFGSGVAIFDCDGDGRLDLYLLTNGGPQSASTNRLFKNMPDGTFKDVTEGSGLGVPGHNMGVAIGDVNNDGLPDVLVTQYRGAKLFLNRGNGKFEDVTKQAGLDNPAWGTSAAFFDYDRDGLLDLVIVNYIDYDESWPCTYLSDKQDYCTPNVFPSFVCRLFHNRGAGTDGMVRFEDVTVKSGLAQAPGPGLGVVCADFDGDGWQDIFVANDGRPNHLWINQKDGTFKEEATTRGLALDSMSKAGAGMGIAIGDVDGDGMLDVFVTHLTIEPHTLWRQVERGLFADQTARAGLLGSRFHGTGFGTLMGDFDQDGALDIAIVNGRIARDKAPTNPALGPHWQWYGERNQLYANDGKGRFTDISNRNRALCGTPNVARGLASGDLNGDGALDLVITTVGAPARVYRNVAPQRGHWLAVRCLLPQYKRDAYGAEVIVEAGRRRWMRSYNPAESYLCSSAPVAHFGLGPVAQVDAIQVLWPDGSCERFAGGNVDRQLVLRQGDGKATERRAP
jgi:enediyne biosynthesis protein E4